MFEIYDDPCAAAQATALFWQGRSISYAELGSRADDIASALPAGRLLVFLECRNDPDALAAYLCCLRAGHVVHLFADVEDLRLDALVGSYRPNVVIRSGPDGQRIVIRHRAPLDLHPELRVLLSTSGSTGSPKFVKLSAGNLASNARAIVDYLDIRPDDRAFLTLKFNYSFGMSIVNSHWMAGASLALSDLSVTAPTFWQEFSDSESTSFSGVPYSFELLSRNADWARTPGLRTVAQAGGKLAPDLARRLARLGRENGWRFFIMYGQTEASPRMAYLPPEQIADHADCIGTAVPGGTLSIVGENGDPITASGVSGELRYSGPNVMMGYAHDIDGLATDETPPFLLTGDIAERNDAGMYRLVGRTARIVKPFGVRINLDEVEALARRFVPDAVCAGSDERLMIAYPAGSTSLQPIEIADAVATALGIPAHIVTAREIAEIPRLATGKVDYATLLGATPVNAAVLGGGPSRQAPFVASGAPSSLSLAERAKLVFSPDFVNEMWHQAKVVIGLRHAEWSSVADIFTRIVNKTGVHQHSSFNALAGDSLSYVTTVLALEDYIGVVPDGWETMTIAQLEEMAHHDLAI